MTQTKTTQRNINATPSRLRRLFGFMRRHKVLAVLLVLIVIYGVAGAVVQTVLWNEKRIERLRFAQAQSDLNDLYVSITKQVGAPSDHKAVQSCSYTSVEIGRGARSCDVDIYVSYPVNDEVQATDFVNKLASSVMQHMPKVKDVTEATQYRDKNNIKTQSFSVETLSCIADYWYFTNGKFPYSTIAFSSSIRSGVFVDFNCNGPAKAEYYPVVRG